MRFGWIVDHESAQHDFTRSLVEACRKRDIGYDLICPSTYCYNPTEGSSWTSDGLRFDPRNYDILVSRSRTLLGQALVSYAEAVKVLTLNSSLATKLIRNKVEVFTIFNNIGVDSVPTTIIDDSSLLPKYHTLQFPLVLKSISDDVSQFIRHPMDLENIHWGKTPIIVQQHVIEESRFLKLYVCGDKVFAIHIPYFSSQDHAHQPHMISPDKRMIELAQRCCGVFNLTFFAIDVLETSEKIMVADIDCYPNFVGVPHAADRVVEHIVASIYKHRAQMNIPLGKCKRHPALEALTTTHASSIIQRNDLSVRELDIACLLISGRSNQQIGDTLHITERTVRYHLQNIYTKLGIQRRSEAIVCLMKMNLPSSPYSSSFQ